MIDSLRETTWTRVQQHWITALLLSAVVIAWLSMLSEADRLRDAETIAAVAISGALYGALLALSRFRGRTALLIDIITSLGLAVLIVGRVLPDSSSLFAQPFDKSLWLMNARLATLGEVLRSDTQWLLTNYFPQTRLFLFLNVLAVWNAAVWLMWGVLRRRRALAAVLPLALLGVMYTALSKDGPRHLGALHRRLRAADGAHGLHVSNARLESPQRRLPRSDRRRLDDLGRGPIDRRCVVGGNQHTRMAQLVSALCRIAASAASAHERTAVPVQVKPQISDNYTPSFVPRMDYVGDSFPVSDQTVFYVTTDDPPSGVDSSGHAKPPQTKALLARRDLRSIYRHRLGAAGLLTSEVPPPASIEPVEPGRYALPQQFDIISLQDNRLFAAGQPVKASDGTILQAARDDPTAVLPRGRSPRYEITSWAPRVTAQELDAASTDYPAEIRATLSATAGHGAAACERSGRAFDAKARPRRMTKRCACKNICASRIPTNSTCPRRRPIAMWPITFSSMRRAVFAVTTPRPWR